MRHVGGRPANPYAAPRRAIFRTVAIMLTFHSIGQKCFCFFFVCTTNSDKEHEQTLSRITDKIPFALSFVTESISYSALMFPQLFGILKFKFVRFFKMGMVKVPERVGFSGTCWSESRLQRGCF